MTLGVTGADESNDPLDVEVLDATVSADGRFATAVSIENRDGLRHELDVYLTLGVFGTGDAWDRRVAETSSQVVGVRSGEELLAVWDETVAVPPGDYELTTWIRMSSAGGQVLSETAKQSVQVTDAGLARVRAIDDGPNLGDVEVEVAGGDFVSIAGDLAPVNLDAFDGAAPGEVSVKVDVLTAALVDPWWSREAQISFVEPVVAQDDGIGNAVVDQTLAAPPGDYVVRVELLVDDVLYDQVLAPGLVTVDPPDPTLVREAIPVGPIAIVNATVDESWADADDALAVVEVQNLTNEPVDGLFWWILAAPGEPEPWAFTEAKSFEVQRRLEPGERRTVRLALDGDVNVGRGFELSVWAHTVPGDGDSEHSDGVRLRALIDTIETDTDNVNGEAQ